MNSKLANLALTAALVFIISCSSDDDNGSQPLPGGGGSGNSNGDGLSSSGGSGIDSIQYKGKTYKTVQIGTQIWMAENLNYNVPGSKCGDEGTGTYTDANTATCDYYGRMYNWATAMGIDAKYNNEELGKSDVNHQGICPPSWHIPSDADWTILTNFAGGESVAGTKLKSKTGWDSYEEQSGNGIDSYEFTALPCCRGTPSGALTDVGKYGTWWSATENSDGGATIRRMSYEDATVDKGNPRQKTYLYSIRCVKDNSVNPPGGGSSSSSSINGISSSSGGSLGGSSSSNTTSGTGSCIDTTYPLCIENVSQAECSEEGGTFSNAACNTPYNYCISLENNLIACNLIGSTDMPSKESCPDDEDGSKIFTTEELCGGSKGSCSFQLLDGDDPSYKLCIDANKGVCEQLYGSEVEGATFQTGECGTTQYPCCFIDGDTVEYFNDSFTKNMCYSRGGMPANVDVCELLGD